MKRSASRPEGHGAATGLLGRIASALGSAIVRNPGYVGGGVAFLVVMGFVSSNALWYQPHAHPEPLLQTRVLVERPLATVPAEPPPVPEPRAQAPAGTDANVTASVPRPTEAPAGDGTVERVQRVLATLKLYDGEIDGLAGPRTRRAVEEYRRLVGLQPGGIDDALLEMIARPEAEPTPTQPPAPRPRVEKAAEAPAQAPSRVAAVQAALRAFGNDDVEVDGAMGGATRRAIEEFQSLFGLPVTGEPDPTLLAKMAEIGLTQ
jgi:peptidoglycan hydrolase-like protein with peptidoglycan-binding domain